MRADNDGSGAPGERVAGDVRPVPLVPGGRAAAFSILLADGAADAHGRMLLAPGRHYAVEALRDPRRVVQQVARAQRGGKPYDLVILSLSSLNGETAGTLQQLRLAAPGSAVLAMAAPGSPQAAAAAQSGVRVLSLPLDPREVDRVVAALAARKAARVSAAEGDLLRQVAGLGRQILSQPTLEAGLKALFGRLAALMGAESLMVAIHDRRGGSLSFPLVYNHGEYLKPNSRRFTPGGLAEWVITNGRPIISGDLAADAGKNGWQLPAGRTPARSALMVPLAVGKGVFGVMAAQSHRRNAFPPDAVALFVAAADTSAAAIANWRLREQREWEEALLTDFDRQLAVATDRGQVLRSSAAAAAQLTAADGAAAVPLGSQGAAADRSIYEYNAPAGKGQPPVLGSWLEEATRGFGSMRAGGSMDPLSATRGAAGPGGPASVLAQPITRGLGTAEQPDAVLWVASAEQRPFDEHDRVLLESVSRRAADALSRIEMGTVREQERAVIRRIARRCAVERDLTLLFSAALTELRKVVPWDSASVWRYDPANEGLRPLKLEGPQAGHDYATVVPLGQGSIGQAAQQGKVLRGGDPGREPLRAIPGPSTPTVALPLWGREGRPGVLMLERVRGGLPFSDEEVGLLGLIGELLAAGIDKSWWHEAAELARRLGTLLTSPGKDTWDAALEAIRDVMPEGACALLIAEDDRPGLRVLTALGSPQLTADTSWLEDEQGPLKDLSAGQALLIEEAGNGAADDTAHGLGSLVAAPFTSGGRVFGALVAWSPRPHRMGERELQLLRRGAEHIAIALFASRESQRADDAQRLLTIMRDIQGQADFGFDMVSVLRKVLEHAIKNTPATSGAVLVREPGDILVQRVQVPDSGAADRRLRVPVGQGAVGQVAQSGELIYLPSVGQSAGIGGEHGSLVAVPVLAAGTAIGVITVTNGKSNAFGEQDIELLRALAGQASSLLDGSHKQNALHQLRRLPRMKVSPAKLLAQVPVLVAETLHAPACTVHVLDRRTNTYVLAGATGVDAASRDGSLREIPGELPSVRALFERESRGEGPLQVVTSDPYASAGYWHAAESRAAGFSTVLAGAISLGKLPYSVISIYAGEGRSFTAAEASVLGALCEQLGQTLFVLYQEYRSGAVSGLGDQLVPRLDADEEFQARALHGEPGPMLEALVRNAVDLSDARCGYILLRNDAEGRFEPRVVVGGAPAEALRWPIDEGAGGRGQGAGGSGDPDVAGSVEASAQHGDGWQVASESLPPAPYSLPPRRSADPTTRSQALVPLTVAGANGARIILGLLGVESPAENAFCDEDLRMLRSLAADAAMLLANAGLYARARGQEQQLSGLLAAMRTMLANLDLTQLQQRLAAAARQALAADLAIVYRHGAGSAANPPAHDGALDADSLGGDVVMHATARKVIADSAERGGKPYFVENVAADPDPGALPQREQLRSMAIVPLVSGGVAVGVLYAAYRRPIRFGPAARRYITAFGEIASLALKNGAAHRSLEDAITHQMQSLSLASHELKEPVDTARMIVETALNGLWQPIGDQLRERLGVVYSLLDNHYQVLTQILQLGKLTAGAQKLVRDPVDVEALLYDIVGNYLGVAESSGIALSANLDPALAGNPVPADAALLKTAVGNLVHNALKFTNGGGKVEVTALIDRRANPAGDLVILVDDNGVGIPEDKLDSVFIPYVQVDQTLSRKHGGIGLGLSLARTIVEQHGGAITAESELGRGSRFVVRMPMG